MEALQETNAGENVYMFLSMSLQTTEYWRKTYGAAATAHNTRVLL